MNSNFNINAVGAIRIVDALSGDVVLEKKNAIHPQNLAQVIARGLASDDNSSVFTLAFGNGGTFYNSSQQLVYRPPNIVGAATLYNETYAVQVDDKDSGTLTTNSVVSSASPAPAISSVVTVQAVLSPSEPNGQAVSDNQTTDPNSPFIFDEMCLKSKDGLMLSHLVFSPIEKTANRAFLIIYTLTISAS